MALHCRPLGRDDAEHDGVAQRSVGKDLMAAQNSVLLRTEPRDRLEEFGLAGTDGDRVALRDAQAESYFGLRALR